MGSYYYFAASLPLLQFSRQAPFTMEKFYADAQQAISKRDYALITEPEAHPLEQALNAYQDEIMRHLAHERAQRVPFETEGVVPTSIDSLSAAHTARAMLEAKDPLEAEIILLYALWQRVDELVGTHMFNEIFLLGYRVKLQIMQRKDLFTLELGSAQFERLFMLLQQKMQSITNGAE